MYLNNDKITINTKLTLGISNLIILVYKLIKVKKKKEHSFQLYSISYEII